MQKYLSGSLALVDAGSRYHQIDNSHDISYNLYLKLKKGESYDGDVTATFSLERVTPNLFFDFAGTTIHEIIINGTTVQALDGYESLRNQRYLRLPEENLKVGKNEVRIRFANLYANDGLGIHSFVDTDGKQYLYSQCEAYAANRVFPCFDQPDLKASLTLTMAVPNEWTPISNQPIDHEKTHGLDRNHYLTEHEQTHFKLAAFEPTLKLPTYLYTFIAGPYLEIKSHHIHRTITMSCYCRESLYPYLEEQAAEIFEITRECIIFFEKFFNYPYPFAKYDSIFCPEYKFGAMEHPGAVTFNDLYIWREKVTLDRNTVRAATITHEASHHWFGDLVTMKWWNDLWLNESFAVYISYYCLTQIESKLKTTKFCDVWLRFFQRKCTGYNADEKKTTHAIAGEVLNTEQAETIFDGITYSKGASTLKQLVSLIGEDNFSKAVSEYFQRFAWKNATIEDFTDCLQLYYNPSFPGCPKDLREWRKEWIETAGLNVCTPRFDPNDISQNAILVINQDAVLKEHPTLRHHKLRIAFFNDQAKIYDSIEIMLSNTPETVITYDGSKKPRAILLNYQDEAFVKVQLDEHSLAFLKENLANVDDELTRMLIWKSLFDMVKGGQFSGLQFALIADQAILHEKSDSILEALFLFITTYLFELTPSVINKNIIQPKFFASTLQRLHQTEKTNTNRTVLLTNHLIQFASFGEERGVDNIVRLALWLDDKDPELEKIHLTIANRWSIVRKLHRYPRFSSTTQQEYFAKVNKLDQSDRSQIHGRYCEAMRAVGPERAQMWKNFLDPTHKVSIRFFQQETQGYNHSLQNKEEHAELFFNEIENVFKIHSGEFAANFYNGLFPHGERIDYYLKRVKEILEKQHGVQNRLTKLLKNSLDDLEMRKRAYECSAPEVLREFFNIHL